MDRYVAECAALQPFPGYERADLPGAVEWRLEREYRRDGIRMSDEHVQALQALADELGVSTPFGRLAATRFGGGRA